MSYEQTKDHEPKGSRNLFWRPENFIGQTNPVGEMVLMNRQQKIKALMDFFGYSRKEAVEAV